ncbi:hypothetical protein ON010_g11564 [Phytophthora cinnamomi]|nr:hypothetical protein ON010_g11564 [Phytophthora cinnamomi]
MTAGACPPGRRTGTVAAVTRASGLAAPPWRLAICEPLGLGRGGSRSFDQIPAGLCEPSCRGGSAATGTSPGPGSTTASFRCNGIAAGRLERLGGAGRLSRAQRAHLELRDVAERGRGRHAGQVAGD